MSTNSSWFSYLKYTWTFSDVKGKGFFFIHKKFQETNGSFASHQCEADQDGVLGNVALSAVTRCKTI